MCADWIESWRCFLVDYYCDPGETRTPDFFLRREALYPLSYGVNDEILAHYAFASLYAPMRDAVTRAWQLAHLTAHFAISPTISSQVDPSRTMFEISADLSRRWSKSSSATLSSPQSTQGCAERYSSMRAASDPRMNVPYPSTFLARGARATYQERAAAR
jgi:hypothetical protein